MISYLPYRLTSRLQHIKTYFWQNVEYFEHAELTKVYIIKRLPLSYRKLALFRGILVIITTTLLLKVLVEL